MCYVQLFIHVFICIYMYSTIYTNKQYKQMQTQSQIPWFEVEIKGMVKNLSPKLWTWTHLRCLYLNDNNLMRLPPVVSSLVNLQILDDF